MVTTKLNLSMTEPHARQIYAKQGDTGRVLDITLDQTPEDGTLRILRPDGVEVTSEAVTGGEISESGETVTFESLTEADVTELTVGIEPVQDLNGYDHPWVGGAGKNLFNATVDGYKAENTNGTWSGNTYTINGVSFALNTDDGGNVISITVNGTSSNSSARLYCPNTPLPANTTFTLHGVPRGYGGTNLALYLGGAMAAIGVNPSTGNGSPVTFTTVTAGNVRPAINVNPNVTITNAVCYPQLELGSTATSFAPYSNICPITGHDEVRVFFGAEQGTADETHTTSLGQTVYGGTLDMVSGVLTVDARYVTVDDFTHWGGDGVSDGGLHWVDVPTSYPKAVGGVINTNACSHAPYMLSGWDATTPAYIVNTAGFPARIYVASASLADFRAEYATLQAVYKLANPVTYQLTPQQIKTLVGTNNVWASSGDIVNIKFTYGGLLSELPSDATSVVGKCYCDVEQNGVSSMPFTLNVKKNERES